MRAAPAVSCASCTKNAHMSIQGSGEHPTFPARWLYGLWRDLPGRAVLVVTVVPWELSPLRNLTPAYRASGPHAFTVRLCRTRQSQHRRPPHPRPSFVAIASAPLNGTGLIGS